MKKLIAAFLVLALSSAVHATSFTFTPTGNTDLSDLSHDSAYTWGISGTNSGGNETTLKNQLNSGYNIATATITITALYNWDVGDTNNQLFIHLLDNTTAGVTTVVDDSADQGVNQGTVSDYFSGNITTNHGIYYSGTNIYLTQYHDADGPTTSITYTFNFNATDISCLTNYIKDANGGLADFGLGFDPDCHFYNTGVTLTVTTAVPDSGATLALFGLGLLGLAGFRRFRRA